MLFKAVPGSLSQPPRLQVCLAVPAAATPTTPTPTAGTIEIWVTPGSGAVAKILVTGAIGDDGTATTIDKNGKVDDNGDYVDVALKHGGFKVNSVELKQIKTPPHP